MAQLTYPLRTEFTHPALASDRWIVTPICLSILIHFLLLAAAQSTGWFEVGEPESPVRRIFTIEAGTVAPEDLERLTMVPDAPAEDICATRGAPQMNADMFPEHRDPGPDESVPEVNPARRYPEEELPVLSEPGLSERSRAFVRDGELDAVTPGQGHITYIPSGRRVGPAPSVAIGADPNLRDNPGGLERGVAGAQSRLAQAGTAPALALKAPSPGGVGPVLSALDVTRDAEGLYADDGRPVPMTPLPLDVKIDVYAEPGSQFRFFRMTIQERQGFKLPVMTKNVLFVVDISSSIRLDMLKSVRAAVANAAAGLNHGDRFNVICFSEQSYKAFDDFVPATAENVERAANAVHKEPGQVRTDVYAALKQVIASLPAAGPEAARPTNIYLVTDGNPTCGIQDIRNIVNDISAVTKSNYSVFAIDPGALTGNTYLLDLLAYRNRGVFVRAKSADATDAALLGLLMQYKDPCLVNLRAQYGNFEVDQVYPETLPNLYAGRPIVIYGRCQPGEQLAVRIIGDSVKDRRKFLYTSTLPEVLGGDKAIAREWARGRIHHLASLIARDGEKKEYRGEIERLSAKYGLASPFE